MLSRKPSIVKVNGCGELLTRVSSEKYLCDDCRHTFRKIALLIITGKVKAKEFIAKEGHDLWDGLTQKHGLRKSAYHGGEWHKEMMGVITEYFESQGFEVIHEPIWFPETEKLPFWTNKVIQSLPLVRSIVCYQHSAPIFIIY